MTTKAQKKAANGRAGISPNSSEPAALTVALHVLEVLQVHCCENYTADQQDPHEHRSCDVNVIVGDANR